MALSDGRSGPTDPRAMQEISPMWLEDLVNFPARHSLFWTSQLIPVTEAATKTAMSELRQFPVFDGVRPLACESRTCGPESLDLDSGAPRFPVHL